jgi:hypothetical protein
MTLEKYFLEILVLMSTWSGCCMRPFSMSVNEDLGTALKYSMTALFEILLPTYNYFSI